MVPLEIETFVLREEVGIMQASRNYWNFGIMNGCLLALYL